MSEFGGKELAIEAVLDLVELVLEREEVLVGGGSAWTHEYDRRFDDLL